MRWSPQSFRVAWGIALLLGPGVAPGAPSGAPVREAEIEAAQDLGARDPAAGGRMLAALRDRALAAGQAAERLRVEEARCRLLNESDAVQSRRVAEAARAETLTEPVSAAVRVAAWRVRSCGAAALLDLGRTDEGIAELEQVLAETRQAADAKPAQAMALLERGLHRSRRGELLAGQADLLEACTALETLRLPRDLELCHWHLANHYKRMGDVDEALPLLESLLESARRRQATADISVYLIGLAQTRLEQQAWGPALAAFQESSALAAAGADRVGVAYAEYGVGQALLRLGRTAEALEHAERSRQLLADGTDPVQGLRTLLLHATLLDALGRPAEALAELPTTPALFTSMRDTRLESDWLRTRASAEARLGRWAQAYASLEQAQRLDQRVHEQRLSQQQARLRMQFNREKDATELLALRRVNEQGERLRTVQGIALGLFVALLAGTLWVATTKLREARRLRVLALIDELTGLPNRRAVLARLDDQVRHARRAGRALSVLVIDVDRFKQVNDRHGHGIGDEVLRRVAQVLGGSLRANDSIGRLGGEEFLAVLPETSAPHAHTIADRMRRLVAEADCRTQAGPLQVTVSIGAAALWGDSESPEQLVERADAALYAAKSGGRDRVCLADEPLAQAA